MSFNQLSMMNLNVSEIEDACGLFVFILQKAMSKYGKREEIENNNDPYVQINHAKLT